MNNQFVLNDIIIDRDDNIQYSNGSQQIELHRMQGVFTQVSIHSSRGYIDWQPLLEQAYLLFGLKEDQLRLASPGKYNPYWRIYTVSGDVDWDKFNGLMAPIRQRIRDIILLQRVEQFSDEELQHALALRMLENYSL